jgi:hypothetical protein
MEKENIKMGGTRLEEYKYKRFAINAAKDLLYPDTVIEAIKRAKSENEISRILTKAREVS